jgi:tetratricopeptide (TPR) repeat protein
MEQNPDPRIVELFEQAHEFYANHKLLQAASVYTTVLSINPDFVPALVQRALVLIELHQLDKVGVIIDHALELDPEYGLAYYARAWLKGFKGDPEGELADAQIGLSLDAPNAHLYYRRIGWAHCRLKDYKAAIKALNKSLKLVSDQPGTYLNRGLCYMDMEKYEHAANDFTHALDLDSNWTSALRMRGRARYFLKQYEPALIDLTRALTFDPGDDISLMWRGETYLAMDSIEKASSDFDKVLMLNKDETNCQHVREHLSRIAER